MRRLPVCLVAGALLLAGCGSGEASTPPTVAPVTSTTTVRGHARSPAPPTTVMHAPATTLVPPPPTTVPAAPPVTVDLCTEALTVAADFELTHEESAARFDALAARTSDPAFAAALQDLAAQFRAGASDVSTAGLDAWCPGAAG
jgi:hypothetical protein